MRSIDIWQMAQADTGDQSASRDRLRALLDALGEAGIRANVLAHDGATMPRAALIWQPDDEPVERARALVVGAAEIVGPWMHPAEVLARCLRHSHDMGAGATAAQLSLGELEIDLIEREARLLGKRLGLLRREYELLCFLARNAEKPQSRATLLSAIWRLRFDPGTNVVEVHVSRLRAKLDRGFDWPMLRTVPGAGYALMTSA